jgi:hypothetical protein
VALSADEGLLVAGTDRGELRLVRVPDGAVSELVQAHRDRVTALAFLGNDLLVSGSRDRSIRLWRCSSSWSSSSSLGGDHLRELLRLPMPKPVRWLAVHPDGVRLLVLLDHERAVRVWHLDRLTARLNGLGLGREGDGLERFRTAKPLLPITVLPEKFVPAVTPSPKGPNGLRAELFADLDMERCTRVRYDAQIHRPWSANGVDPLLPKERFSIRWSGWLKAPRPARYTLRLDSTGGARLWLDNQLRIEHPGRGPWAHGVEVELTDGPHALRVEYYSPTDGSGIALAWSQPGHFPLQPVPTSALFHDRARAARAVVPLPPGREKK